MLEYDRKQPLGARWKPLRGIDMADSTKEALDRLYMFGVVWSLYASRRDLRPFEGKHVTICTREGFEVI